MLCPHAEINHNHSHPSDLQKTANAVLHPSNRHLSYTPVHLLGRPLRLTVGVGQSSSSVNDRSDGYITDGQPCLQDAYACKYVSMYGVGMNTQGHYVINHKTRS